MYVFYVVLLCIHLQVQVKTGLEKAKIQEETIEQLREDANSQSNTTMLQHELKDLEHLYADGRQNLTLVELYVYVHVCTDTGMYTIVHVCLLTYLFRSSPLSFSSPPPLPPSLFLSLSHFHSL